MQGRLAFCLRASVLALAVFACSSDEPTGPGDPDDPGTPPLPATVSWSDGATWPGGQVPAAGAAVVIPEGKAVRLDVSPPPLASLRIEGALVFDERDLELTAGHILVLGTLRVGTSASPFSHRATITLTGTAADGNVMGMGNRVLGVAGGTLDLHGEARQGWTRLGVTATAGSAQLQLAEAPGWRAGDRLVVASTDFEPGHAEVVAVASVSGATVTLEQPLAFTHYGELQTIAGRTVDERAEVGLLTRNVVVRGDSATSAGGYGGHVMGTGGTLRVSGVTLRFMGQRGLMARYPMHWHLMGPVDGQYFAGNSVWGSFNRCVTVHGTDNARVEGNVCHDHLGHGYFLEDGAETGNLIAGNLGLGTSIAGRRRRSRPTTAPPPSGSPTPTIPCAGTPQPAPRASASGMRCRPRRPASPSGSPSCPGTPRCASSAATSPTPTGAAACTWTTGRGPTAPPRPSSMPRAPIRPMPTPRSSPTSPGSPRGSTPAAPSGSGAAIIVSATP